MTTLKKTAHLTILTKRNIFSYIYTTYQGFIFAQFIKNEHVFYTLFVCFS